MKTLAMLTFALLFGVAQPADPYEQAVKAALKANLALVVGVGCSPPAGAWEIVFVKRLGEYRPPCMVVSAPRDGYLRWLATLPPTATADDVRAALGMKPRQVRPKAGWTWSNEDVPPWFKPYRSARFTQEIAVTNGRDRITPVPRSQLEEKWRVPGGLVGIGGWKSDLYKWADGEEWVGNISVLNSLGYFQDNRGWKRSYSDGSEFLDVLTNTETGKVFEVRKAMKQNGQWQRFVTYRDASQRPHGYAGPGKLDCHSCHNQAGTGGYATGLIPGGDTVLSDPLPLE